MKFSKVCLTIPKHWKVLQDPRSIVVEEMDRIIILELESIRLFQTRAGAESKSQREKFTRKINVQKKLTNTTQNIVYKDIWFLPAVRAFSVDLPRPFRSHW